MRGAKSRRFQRGIVAATCVLVIGVYVRVARSGLLELFSPSAADTYYNLLVQGFGAGHLSLKQDVPLGLQRLADPYDPSANAVYRAPPYRMLDMSYYKGRVYLYFGVTPALMLFWPYAALTGHYLLHRQAVVIFCAVGFLASVWLLHALWQRYFPNRSVVVLMACVLALGLGTGIPVLLARSDVYEVPISCGYMLTMLTLGAAWRAVHDSERRGRWLAAASLAYGLAVGARPSLLFGGFVLLVPVAQAWRQRRRVWPLVITAVVPIAAIGVGLMLYNFLRFDNPFEFGVRYQLGGDRQVSQKLFGLHYFWFNFRVFFLEPARWSSRFPFVRNSAVPPMPVGHGRVEAPFGVLTNMPLVWLALAVPLAWRGRPPEERGVLRWFLAAVALLFGACGFTACLFHAANFRYEVEFLPELLLLAVVGILGLERTLAPTSGSETAQRQGWRRLVRWGWSLLLGFSVAFNLLAGVDRYAVTDNELGIAFQKMGRVPEAIAQFEQAVRLNPGYTEAHYDLGNTLLKTGNPTAAIEQLNEAARLKPDFAEAHYSLGVALMELNRLPEAVEHFQQALRIEPDRAQIHNSLGAALMGLGRLSEATEQYEQALQLEPDFAEAHYNLGTALKQAGNIAAAIGHYERALRIRPDYAEAQNNLGTALAALGRVPEAMEHWERALELKPDFAEAHNNLGSALLGLGKVPEAIEQYEQAARVKPDYANAQYNLGTALERAGRVPEAIEHYEQAVRIEPDLVEAQKALARLRFAR
ncbi:MAG TPA: tetratricopeptide repeat protein [Verrucomicrobiae bacterium]|nr:tetratricopeptide repeat protein [Verrucomicrobiae bacterium]